MTRSSISLSFPQLQSPLLQTHHPASKLGFRGELGSVPVLMNLQMSTSEKHSGDVGSRFNSPISYAKIGLVKSGELQASMSSNDSDSMLIT